MWVVNRNCLAIIIEDSIFMKRFETLLFYKCISMKVIEQIVNPILFFSANFKRFCQMKVNSIEKLRSDGCCHFTCKIQ